MPNRLRTESPPLCCRRSPGTPSHKRDKPKIKHDDNTLKMHHIVAKFAWRRVDLYYFYVKLNSYQTELDTSQVKMDALLWKPVVLAIKPNMSQIKNSCFTLHWRPSEKVRLIYCLKKILYDVLKFSKISLPQKVNPVKMNVWYFVKSLFFKDTLWSKTCFKAQKNRYFQW